jgi:hypothetical protein
MRLAGVAGAILTSAAMRLPANAMAWWAAQRFTRATRSTSTSDLDRKSQAVAAVAAAQAVRISTITGAGPVVVVPDLQQDWAALSMETAKPARKER